MSTGTALAVIAPQRRDLATIDADLKRVTAEHQAAVRDRKGQNLLALARVHIASQVIGEVLHAAMAGTQHLIQTQAAAMQHQHSMNMTALKVAAMALHAAASRPPVPFEPPPPPRLSAAQLAELHRVPALGHLYRGGRSDPANREISDPTMYRIVVESLNDAIAAATKKKRRR